MFVRKMCIVSPSVSDSPGSPRLANGSFQKCTHHQGKSFRSWPTELCICRILSASVALVDSGTSANGKDMNLSICNTFAFPRSRGVDGPGRGGRDKSWRGVAKLPMARRDVEPLRVGCGCGRDKSRREVARWPGFPSTV